MKSRIPEYRANEIKSLEEKRGILYKEMQELLSNSKKELRAMNEDEDKRFKEIETEIKSIDNTISAEKRALELAVSQNKLEPDSGGKPKSVQEEAELRAFKNYITGVIEERADINLTVTDNGAVIPSSIADKIIAKVVEISPLLQLATKYNIGGTLSIPMYDESTQSIQMTYASEFVELESSGGKFKSIELKGFLAGALSKISLSLTNNSKFDVVNYTINAMANSIARWIEKELLIGTTSKIEGLSGISSNMVLTSASGTAITTDELIKCQDLIKDAFQSAAVWIMSSTTRTALRLLKDNEGRYLLNPDITAKWGYKLLGKDVYVTDNLPGIEAGKTAIFYGDFSGLAVKISEDVSIQVLREKYATQHAIGVVAWLEMDAKIENVQKISALKIKAA